MQTVSLKDICLDKGFYGISASACKYDPSYPQYIRITDIDDDGRYHPNEKASINPKIYPDYKNYYLQENDIILARTGTTGRNYFYNPNDGNLVFAGFMIKFSLNPNLVLPKFIKYYCQSNSYWYWIKNNCNGTTRQNLNANDYANMPIPLLPFAIQRHIVDLAC